MPKAGLLFLLVDLAMVRNGLTCCGDNCLDGEAFGLNGLCSALLDYSVMFGRSYSDAFLLGGVSSTGSLAFVFSLMKPSSMLESIFYTCLWSLLSIFLVG